MWCSVACTASPRCRRRCRWLRVITAGGVWVRIRLHTWLHVLPRPRAAYAWVQRLRACKKRHAYLHAQYRWPAARNRCPAARRRDALAAHGPFPVMWGNARWAVSLVVCEIVCVCACGGQACFRCKLDSRCSPVLGQRHSRHATIANSLQCPPTRTHVCPISTCIPFLLLLPLRTAKSTVVRTLAPAQSSLTDGLVQNRKDRTHRGP